MAKKSENTEPDISIDCQDKRPKRRHLLIGLAILAALFSAGIYLLSMAILAGLVIVIIAAAIAVGILMAALRIHYHRASDTDQPAWRTRTWPLTSLVLIVGVAVVITCWAASM